MKIWSVITLGTILVLLIACDQTKNEKTEQQNEQEALPFLGPKDVGADGDSVYHTIPEFGFLNQDSVLITNKDVKGRVYVANFFFTSCPKICPKVINQMKRLQQMVKDVDEIILLSHTVDPKRDTLAKMRAYIEKYKLDTHNWHFLRGSKPYTYEIAKQGYLATATQDPNADGGFIHSQHLILIDREGHIRSMRDGTKTEEVDKLEEEIRTLLASYGND